MVGGPPCQEFSTPGRSSSSTYTPSTRSTPTPSSWCVASRLRRENACTDPAIAGFDWRKGVSTSRSAVRRSWSGGPSTSRTSPTTSFTRTFSPRMPGLQGLLLCLIANFDRKQQHLHGICGWRGMSLAVPAAIPTSGAGSLYVGWVWPSRRLRRPRCQPRDQIPVTFCSQLSAS